MTISSSNRKAGPFTGNGVTVAFPFAFKVFTTADVLVVQAVTATGVETTLELGTNYTVSLNADQNANPGGTITMLVAPPTGTMLVATSQVANLQPLDVTNGGGFYPAVLNASFDRVVIQVQQLAEKISRSLVGGLSSSADLTLPLPKPGYVLGWNVLGTGLTNIASTVSAFLVDLAASSGSSLVGFVQSSIGAVLRTVQDKLREGMSVKDFGAIGDGITDDTTAIQKAFDAAKLAGGGDIYLPKGTYAVSSAINITGCNNIIFYGAGNDASIIKSTSTTADVFYDSGTSWWRTFRDFSISSSVTKTAGSSFSLAGERRGLFDRVRITGHFNGFKMLGFEQTEIRSCSVTKPSGAGSAVQCGTSGTAGQGANLLINSCFLRGGDDVTQLPASTFGLYGILIYDVDAVFAMNTDVGGFLSCDMAILPATRSANHFFTQCFFDATKNSDCVQLGGAGIKQQISFTGCWVASAGKNTGGNIEACGVRAFNAGSYQDIIFSGCRFYNNSGTGILMEMPGCDFNLTGCNFLYNGATAVTNRYGAWFAPASTATVGPIFSGCKFNGGNGSADLRLEGGARKYTVAGCTFTVGVSNAGVNGAFGGNVDESVAASIASVNRLAINSTQNFVNVTGTTNIAGMDPTYPGHVVVLHFTAVLVVIDNSQNLRLVSNFTTAVDSTLTLYCDGIEWREIARANT
jgi:hypothetical protein